LARKTNGKPQLPTKNWHWLLKGGHVLPVLACGAGKGVM
jgi:hypothetical protein